MKAIITVETTVQIPVEKTWELWTKPEHITQWNNATDDWHTPYAENDLRTGGKFLSRMAAKDGSVSFDFTGRYLTVKPNEQIIYEIADGRQVQISFTRVGNTTNIVESFEAEEIHSHDLQKGGWQSILNNFKKYAESNH